jgi:hypothetical protein
MAEARHGVTVVVDVVADDSAEVEGGVAPDCDRSAGSVVDLVLLDCDVVGLEAFDTSGVVGAESRRRCCVQVQPLDGDVVGLDIEDWAIHAIVSNVGYLGPRAGDGQRLVDDNVQFGVGALAHADDIAGVGGRHRVHDVRVEDDWSRFAGLAVVIHDQRACSRDRRR